MFFCLPHLHSTPPLGGSRRPSLLAAKTTTNIVGRQCSPVCPGLSPACAYEIISMQTKKISILTWTNGHSPLPIYTQSVLRLNLQTRGCLFATDCSMNLSSFTSIQALQCNTDNRCRATTYVVENLLCHSKSVTVFRNIPPSMACVRYCYSRSTVL